MSNGIVVPLLAALSLAAPTAAGAQQEMQEMAPAIAVEEAVITTDVQDRQPLDNLSTVAADVGQVYCWTRITGVQDETDIEHVWFRAGEEMARVSLRVAGPNWRTWSSKTILPEWTGEWRVDVVGPDGTVLRSVDFTVR
jgi:hypothetical protein